jgi:hypothetical protein
MQIDLEDAVFRDTVESWLRDLDDDVVVDLNEVFGRSPGVYPTTLIELWRQELHDRQLVPVPPTAGARVLAADGGLPAGHPVDADWRFTSQSSSELIRLATDGLPAGASVAHVGAPSTFLRCVLAKDQQRHILVDRNTAVIDALAAKGVGPPHIMLGVDLAAVARLHVGVHAAIVDPPWYASDTRLFLAVTASMCEPNATVVLCQPAVATRPGVTQERSVVLEQLNELGLEFHGLCSGAVRYATPHFEAVSLRAAVDGVAIPLGWRRGDVLVLKRTESGSPTLSLPPSNDSWHEVTFGPVRIKLAIQSTGVELGSLVSGDVLATVSRRDPVRPHIGMWTSGNRIFTVASPDTIAKLIRMCEADRMAGRFDVDSVAANAGQLQLSNGIARRLYEILSAELAEHIKLGGFGDG